MADRQSMVTSDLLRSIFLLVISAGLIWAFTTQKIKSTVFVAVLGVLAALDLALVDKRYFNNDDFQTKTRVAESFNPSPADEQIMQDKDPDFRVVDMATNQGFFADATASYFHKSVGGYHGAKLKRIQELYDNAMTKDGKYNLPIFNMLNTKYFITPGQDGNPVAQRNPDALGNAWFVGEVKTVKNADEETRQKADKLIKSIARLEVNLRGSNVNPTNALQQLNSMQSPSLANSQAALLVSWIKWAYRPSMRLTDTTCESIAIFQQDKYGMIQRLKTNLEMKQKSWQEATL
jgi:hypothetical protein